MFKSLTKIFQSGQFKAIVLCYHRVAEDNMDPWELAVSPANFEEQLRMMHKKFRVIPVNDLTASNTKNSGAKSICITFDDGYTDNYTVAKPLLEKYNLPGCFFIASAYIGKRSYFWWDELTDIVLLENVLPARLNLSLGNEKIVFDNTDGTVLTEDQKQQLSAWRAKKPPVHKRCELYLQLWHAIRLLTPENVQSTMQQLRDWAEFKPAQLQPDRLPMTETELNDLASTPLFTIGMHTANHVALDSHPMALQEEELKRNKAELQNILRKPVKIVSFPYGKYNDDTLQIMRQHEISSGFASKKEVVTKQSDATRIGRFAIGNWPAEKLEKKLQNWFATR